MVVKPRSLEKGRGFFEYGPELLVEVLEWGVFCVDLLTKIVCH